MGTTIDTGLTVRGLNGAFRPAFEAARTLWREICTVVVSDGASESYRWLGQIPAVREWRGERVGQSLRDFGQTLINRHWEHTMPIDRDEIADDQTGTLANRAASAGTRFAMHPDSELLDRINTGAATVCYDGQFFFDTDHLEGDSTSQSNIVSVDINTTTAPTLSEFREMIFAAVIRLAGFRDDQGEPWNFFQSMESFDGIVVLVPFNYFDVASQVFGASAAPLLNAGSNNIAGRGRVFINPLYNGGATPTTGTQMIVLKVDDSERPFIFQTRQTIRQYLVDDQLKKDLVYGADARYVLGYGLWQKAILVQAA